MNSLPIRRTTVTVLQEDTWLQKVLGKGYCPLLMGSDFFRLQTSYAPPYCYDLALLCYPKLETEEEDWKLFLRCLKPHYVLGQRVVIEEENRPHISLYIRDLPTRQLADQPGPTVYPRSILINPQVPRYPIAAGYTYWEQALTQGYRVLYEANIIDVTKAVDIVCRVSLKLPDDQNAWELEMNFDRVPYGQFDDIMEVQTRKPKKTLLG